MADTGLVLGAGGLVGHAYHAGTLAALADHGWDARWASVIVGTSAGSGVGALLRAGLPPGDLVGRLLGSPLSYEGQRLLAGAPPPMREPPRQRPPTRGMPRPASPELLARTTFLWWRARPGHFVAGGLPEGREPTAIIGDRVRAVYRGRRWPVEDLWICALRLRDGRRVVFGRPGAPLAEIGTAVEASSSIPGVYAPVAIDGERYVDGGAHSPTNADLLARSPLARVVVVSPMSVRPEVRLRPDTAMRHWLHRQLSRELAPLRAAGVEVRLFEPGEDDLAVMGLSAQAMEGARMGDVVRQARRSASALMTDRPLAE